MSDQSGSVSGSASSPLSTSSPVTTTTTTTTTSSSSSSISSALPPPTSSSSVVTTSSSVLTTSSTSLPASSTTPSTTSTPLKVSTAPGGSIVTLTQIQSITSSGLSASSTPAVRTSAGGFFQNKAAVGATFAIVALVVVGIVFGLITNGIRRRRARQFDREIAEEAKRAPPTVFLDDEDDYNNGMGGGYSTYGAAAQDPYAAHPDQQQHYGGPPSSGHAMSTNAMSGEGTPSNYMYPSGYSDLGFSDVSSHGTYSQQPMDGQYNGTGGGYGNYEMTGYGAVGHMPGYGQPQQQQDWHGHGQQAYIYPGEDVTAGGYPPTATAVTTDAPNLARSKSAGGARSLVDPYNTPPAEPVKQAAVPQYADGYVAQYQTPHAVETEDAYGGVESEHGHVEYDYGPQEDEQGGHRVLKVANE